MVCGDETTKPAMMTSLALVLVLCGIGAKPKIMWVAIMLATEKESTLYTAWYWRSDTAYNTTAGKTN